MATDQEGMCTFALDADGLVTDWRAPAQADLNFSKEALEGKHFTALFAPFEEQAVMDLMKRSTGSFALEHASLVALSGRNTYVTLSVWMTTVQAHGQFLWVGVVGKYVSRSSSKVVEKATPPAQEPEEKIRRRQMVNDFNKTVSELNRAREESRAIVETANDAFLTTDFEGIVEAWNTQAELIFGWTRHEAIGRNLTELIIPEHMRQRHQMGMKRYMENDGPTIDLTRLEVPALRCNGQQFPVELTVWATGAGKERKFHSFLRDISIKKADEARHNARYEVAKTLLMNDNVTQAIQSTLEIICRMLDWQVAMFWKHDGKVMRCQQWHITPTTSCEDFLAMSRVLSFLPGAGTVGRAWREEQPVWVEDIHTDQGFVRNPGASSCKLKSSFAFPVRTESEVVGVVEAFSQHERAEDPALLDAMADIGAMLGHVLQRNGSSFRDTVE